MRHVKSYVSPQENDPQTGVEGQSKNILIDFRKYGGKLPKIG